MTQTLTRTGMVIPSADGSDAVHIQDDIRTPSLYFEAHGLIFLPPGLDSARPAASIVGRIYKPIDVTGIVYYDNGSTWETLGASAAIDAAANVGSSRTLGGGALQAAAGNHGHAFSALSTGAFTENVSLDQVTALSADGKYAGLARSGTAGATLAFGQVCYLDPSASKWMLADANSVAGSSGDPCGIIGVCVLAASTNGATKMLLWGTVRADAQFPTMTVNAPLYVSETAGGVVVTQPSTSGVVIRVVGHALTADELFFQPSPDWITHG